MAVIQVKPLPLTIESIGEMTGKQLLQHIRHIKPGERMIAHDNGVDDVVNRPLSDFVNNVYTRQMKYTMESIKKAGATNDQIQLIVERWIKENPNASDVALTQAEVTKAVG